jgi:hypothetical protein
MYPTSLLGFIPWITITLHFIVTAIPDMVSIPSWFPFSRECTHQLPASFLISYNLFMPPAVSCCQFPFPELRFHRRLSMESGNCAACSRFSGVFGARPSRSRSSRIYEAFQYRPGHSCQLCHVIP